MEEKIDIKFSSLVVL